MAPYVTSGIYAVMVNITQVHTSDSDEGDNARVRYVIIGKLSKTFQVNSHGGISLLKTVDTEDIESLSFIVYAVDLGTPPLVGWARVVITTAVLPSSTPVCIVLCLQYYLTLNYSRIDFSRNNFYKK